MIAMRPESSTECEGAIALLRAATKRELERGRDDLAQRLLEIVAKIREVVFREQEMLAREEGALARSKAEKESDARSRR